MWSWMTSRTAGPNSCRPALRLEALEDREVPAVLIQVDYSLDSSGFFANNPAARECVAEAPGRVVNRVALRHGRDACRLRRGFGGGFCGRARFGLFDRVRQRGDHDA